MFKYRNLGNFFCIKTICSHSKHCFYEIFTYKAKWQYWTCQFLSMEPVATSLSLLIICWWNIRANINITQKRFCKSLKPTERGNHSVGMWQWDLGLAGFRRERVGLFVDFVDFQFLKCIPLVGGLTGLLVRVSIVKRLSRDSIIP
jgi:hypothetical protein